MHSFVYVCVEDVGVTGCSNIQALLPAGQLHCMLVGLRVRGAEMNSGMVGGGSFSWADKQATSCALEVLSALQWRRGQEHQPAAAGLLPLASQQMIALSFLRLSCERWWSEIGSKIKKAQTIRLISTVTAALKESSHKNHVNFNKIHFDVEDFFPAFIYIQSKT